LKNKCAFPRPPPVGDGWLTGDAAASTTRGFSWRDSQSAVFYMMRIHLRGIYLHATRDLSSHSDGCLFEKQMCVPKTSACGWWLAYLRCGRFDHPWILVTSQSVCGILHGAYTHRRHLTFCHEGSILSFGWKPVAWRIVRLKAKGVGCRSGGDEWSMHVVWPLDW
jgi:hypothetical protein